MATQIATHVELRKNRDGQDRAHIAGTRVRVQDVYAYSEIHGLDADKIDRTVSVDFLRRSEQLRLWIGPVERPLAA